MFTIGNEEKDKLPSLKIGDLIDCPHCGGQHKVKGGKNEDGEETDLIMAYTCALKDNPYLCGVDGKNIMSKLK